MNSKLESFKDLVKDKRVAVLGVGISNKPLITMLLSYGAIVTACDKREEISDEIMNLMAQGVRFNLGSKYLDNLDYDIIFKTPGIRIDTPQLAEAKRMGVMITSEMEVFFNVCPCKIIGVTGSDGKTTTSTLIYKLLTEQGYNCHLGGNIGTPLLPLIESIDKNDIAVVELSSFQLHTMRKSPSVAVVTNMSPNHLDMHKSMEEYIDAKKHIFLHQGKTGRLIIYADNEITASFASEAKGSVIPFSRNPDATEGVYLKDGKIYMDGEFILDQKDILLPGIHNVENYMAAIAACKDMVTPETIQKTARTFAGVEHRIEFVREVDGVKFYNDSIASSPTRARACLYSFDKKIILIAGGSDKHISFTNFGYDIKERVKRLYLVGATSQKIKEAVLRACGGKKIMHIEIFQTLETAVKEAYMGAEAGDVVVLSPACASFDMFKNFEERGKRFKEIVRGL